MKSKPDYLVRVRFGKKSAWLFGAIFCAAMAVGIALVALNEPEIIRQIWAITAALILVCIFLFTAAIKRFARLCRATVKVYADRLVYRDGKGRKSEMHITDITSRVVERVAGDGMSWGAFWAALFSVNINETVERIRYRCGGRYVLGVDSTMKNAAKLDAQVKAHLKNCADNEDACSIELKSDKMKIAEDE